MSMLIIDGIVLCVGGVVHDIVLGSGIVSNIGDGGTWFEINLAGRGRIIADSMGCVAGRRRIYPIAPTLVTFKNSEQRALVLEMIKLMGACVVA